MSSQEDRAIALNDFAGGGVVPLSYADGPCGVRGDDGATALPSALVLASSFDRGLAREYGDLLGAEVRASGRNTLLGPALDLARDPRAGRLGEALGEDPLLVGEIGGQVIRGIQGRRVIAVAKHYTAYNLERLRTGEGPYERRSDARDVVVSARALQEMYLWPFRHTVLRHGVVALLAAYVRVNGTYMAQHPDLLGLPRREWGFDGLTLPDFLFAVRDAQAALDAGLDLPAIALPGPEPLAVRTPDMVAALPDDAVARIGEHVRAAIARVDLAPPSASADRSALATDHALTLAERVAVEGAVLLANDGTLPLAAPSRIALIGGEELAHRLVIGGSAGVPIPDERVLDLERALRAEGLPVTARAGGMPDVPAPPLTADDGVAISATIADARGVREIALDAAVLPDGATDPAQPWTAELTCTLPPGLGDVALSLDFAGHADVLCDGEVVASGFRDASPLLSGPAYVLSAVVGAAPRPRTITVHYRTGSAFVLPAIGMVPRLTLGVVPIAPQAAAAAAAAADADVAVVLAGRATGAGMDAEDLGLPAGQAQLIDAVVATGTPTVVVLHGSGPVDAPWRHDVAAVLHVGNPGERFAPALARLLSGAAEPGGRLALTWPDGEPPLPRAEIDADGRLEYAEGVDIGHRGYERAGSEPAFWFGHGLGYAHIELIDAVPDAAAVIVRLRCGQDRGGKAVIQLYARPCAGETLRLVGFEVARLAPGEERETRVAVERDALATWVGDRWSHPIGAEIHVGFSRGDLRASVRVEAM